MKKLLFLIFAVALLYVGYRWYRQRAQTGTTALPESVSVGLNSEVDNSTAINLHCISTDDVNQITNKNYTLLNEVYTASVKLLECSYQDSAQVDNVNPTIGYKLQLTNDANGIWSRQQTTVQAEPSYKDSSDFPDAFADLNPVKEISQGTFYGKNATSYVELTYTPVTLGSDAVFNQGMQLMEKVLGN